MNVRRLLLSLVAAGLALGACGGVSTEFSADRSVKILAPRPLDVVRAPFELRWTGDLGPGESFAVFVDRTPLRPGRSFADVFDEECEKNPDCPDENFLGARNIHITDGTEVTVPLVTILAGVDGAPRRQVHRATIVVVDDDGVRVGERAWSTEFRVAR